MTISTLPVPRDGITEIVAHHDAALADFARYFDAIEAAKSHLASGMKTLASLTGSVTPWPYVDGRKAPEVDAFRAAIDLPDAEQMRCVSQRLLDIIGWQEVLKRTELESLMDKTARDELRAQMTYIPERVSRRNGSVIDREEIGRQIPELTEDAIVATLEKFTEDADNIWKRGIATAFCDLDRRFRSHDGFKIKHRIILSRAFGEWGSWCTYGHHQETLQDIERVFLVLDKDRQPILDEQGGELPYQGIVSIIDRQRRMMGRGGMCGFQSVHEGDYFRVRIFQNGNAHLWITRKDLLDQVNQLLADYYGAGLGWGDAREEDPDQPFDLAMERAPARNYGFFPTPDALAEKVIEAAQLWSETPLRILEPSAGSGQLSRRAVNPSAGQGWARGYGDQCARHRVDVIEIQDELAHELDASCLYSRVIHQNFLTFEPPPASSLASFGVLGYDRIVMNPPFDRQRDVDHVHHALKFLAPGGRLVAVMSAGVEFSALPRAKALREQLDRSPFKARWQDLPAGSFRDVGTNVNTVLLTVERK